MSDKPKKRLKNTKAKGRRREQQTIEMYEALGYAANTSAASLGLFDVICLGPHDNLAIQVKSNKGPGKAEMARLRAFRCAPFTHKLVVIWKDREPKPEIIHLDNGMARELDRPRCDCINGCLRCGGLPG